MQAPLRRPDRRALAAAVFALAVLMIPVDATAQVVAARRMSMGGVILSNGSEREAQNVSRIWQICLDLVGSKLNKPCENGSSGLDASQSP